MSQHFSAGVSPVGFDSCHTSSDAETEWRAVFVAARECRAVWVDGQTRDWLERCGVPIWYTNVLRRNDASTGFVSPLPVVHAFAPHWAVDLAYYGYGYLRRAAAERVMRRLAADPVAARMAEAHPESIRKLFDAETE